MSHYVDRVSLPLSEPFVGWEEEPPGGPARSPGGAAPAEETVAQPARESFAPAPRLAPEVSVVVPTFRRPDLLARCLDALRAQDLSGGRFEIIVCDDACEPQARAQAEAAAHAAPETGPCVTYLPVRGRHGPAAARNRGWRAARGEVIAFTDDDTVPEPDWLRRGLAALRETGADAVAGRIEMPLPPRPTDLQRDAAGLCRAEFATANAFVRRAAMQRVEGFDERYTLAWREDSDLHFRLLEAGMQVVGAPQAVVVHPLRPMGFAAGLGMQKKIVFDTLLYKRHPRLYRERVRAGPPWFYLAVTAALATACVLAAAGARLPAAAAAAIWLALSLLFFARRLRGVSHTPRSLAELALTSLAIPPLSIFWRIVGSLRWRAGLP